MNNDSELLEAAAKAYGIKLIGPMGNAGLILFNGNLWNPLTDDGDALRLAVKLDMAVDIWGSDVKAIAFGGGVALEQVVNDDPYAATRRAIVRAAAEIGKDMV